MELSPFPEPQNLHSRKYALQKWFGMADPCVCGYVMPTHCSTGALICNFFRVAITLVHNPVRLEDNSAFTVAGGMQLHAPFRMSIEGLEQESWLQLFFSSPWKSWPQHPIAVCICEPRWLTTYISTHTREEPFSQAWVDKLVVGGWEAMVSIWRFRLKCDRDRDTTEPVKAFRNKVNKPESQLNLQGIPLTYGGPETCLAKWKIRRTCSDITCLLTRVFCPVPNPGKPAATFSLICIGVFSEGHWWN